MKIPRGSECKCGACGETFTGLGLFERHQKVDYNASPPIYCLSPVDMGLVQDAGGTWGTPEGLKARERMTTTLARARSERTS